MINSMNHDLVRSVSELLERHWDVYQISAKLNLNPDVIQSVLDIINGVL